MIHVCVDCNIIIKRDDCSRKGNTDPEKHAMSHVWRYCERCDDPSDSDTEESE